MRTEIPRHQKEAGVGFFEHLPSNVIADIKMNEQMKEGVEDPRLLQWFDEDFLIRNAAIFALGGTNGLPRLQTPTSHRGVILKKDTPFADEYGVVHGEIGVKGTGFSHNGLNSYGYDGSANNPLGFFGLTHSQTEMKLSDRFAQIGGRGGRVIAVMTMNPDKLRSWATSDSQNADFRYPFFKMLDVVKYNGDTPALCVRLMGTDRIQDYKNAANSGYYNQGKMLSRAARLMLGQINAMGDRVFLERYKLHEYYRFRTDMLEIMLRDGQFESGDAKALKSLAFLQRYFVRWNLAHVKKLSDDYYHGTLTYKGSPQDVDMLGSFYDWETSLWHDAQYYPDSEGGDNKRIKREAKFWIDPRDHKEVSSVVNDAVGIAGF